MWEISDGDVKMRILAQSFIGEVKTWFIGFVAGSIVDYDAFKREFLDKWEDKKNPFQLLTQYNNLKRNQSEIAGVFFKVYENLSVNSIVI